MFKVGDRVRCIDSGGHSTLQFGEIYEVIRSDGSGLYVKDPVGAEGYGYFQRFELVTEEPKEVKYIIRYDLTSRDPWEEIYSDKDLTKRLLELYAQADVVKGSIVVYPVTGALKPQFNTSVRLLGLSKKTEVKLVKRGRPRKK